jgi:glycosyltransferase involved in cell wall biosynthesis
MATPPLVSVVMPAYNSVRYLAHAVESVRLQTLTSWQLIIVDDGSTDDTPRLLHDYQDDSRILCLRQDNAGPAAARNTALAIAAGRYVAFLDADDAWPPDYLESMTAALDASAECVMAYCGWQVTDEDGRLLPQVVHVHPGQVARLRQELTWRNQIMPSGVLARRQAVEACGGFDTSLRGTEDWDLFVRLMAVGEFAGVPDVLMHYRAHPDNFSDGIEAMEQARFRVHGKHLGGFDQQASTWPPARRQAAAYAVFISALAYLRLGRNEAALAKLAAALRDWPELLWLDEFYYEMACAYQQRGYRGSGTGLQLERSAELLRQTVLGEPTTHLSSGQRQEAWGRAGLAMAQLALVAGHKRLAGRFAWQALRLAPPRYNGPALRLLVRASLPAVVVRGLRAARTRIRPGTS